MSNQNVISKVLLLALLILLVVLPAKSQTSQIEVSVDPSLDTPVIGLPDGWPFPPTPDEDEQMLRLRQQEQQMEAEQRVEAERQRHREEAAVYEQERQKQDEEVTAALERERAREQALSKVASGIVLSHVAVVAPGPDGQVQVQLGLAEPGAVSRAIPRSIAMSGIPVSYASNLFGFYLVGRGAQFLTWTQPLGKLGSADPDYSGYRLYWWTPGSTVTNTVNFPRGVQKALMSGVAGANKPLTLFQVTVVNGGVESAASNVLLVSPEP